MKSQSEESRCDTYTLQNNLYRKIPSNILMDFITINHTILDVELTMPIHQEDPLPSFPPAKEESEKKEHNPDPIIGNEGKVVVAMRVTINQQKTIHKKTKIITSIETKPVYQKDALNKQSQSHIKKQESIPTDDDYHLFGYLLSMSLSFILILLSIQRSRTL